MILALEGRLLRQSQTVALSERGLSSEHRPRRKLAEPQRRRSPSLERSRVPERFGGASVASSSLGSGSDPGPIYNLDARSVLLTPNSETVYGATYLALAEDGPTVVEVPPGVLGVFNDMWMREIENIGPLGQDKGAGGSYLVLPPGYD